VSPALQPADAEPPLPPEHGLAGFMRY
jgi:hypothetical protein